MAEALTVCQLSVCRKCLSRDLGNRWKSWKTIQQSDILPISPANKKQQKPTTSNKKVDNLEVASSGNWNDINVIGMMGLCTGSCFGKTRLLKAAGYVDESSGNEARMGRMISESMSLV